MEGSRQPVGVQPAPAAQQVARWGDPVRWALLGMTVAWSATFVALGLLRHARFGTFGFDLGIYDQGIWLTSRGLDPFVTVRGIDLWGHHLDLVFLLLAPFYRLGAGPELLLVVQVLAQASGAAAVFLLARDLLGDRRLGLVLAAALLSNPTYQWLTWEFFHPDALAIGPLLFAYWAARQRRWGWFTVAAALAISCKEDVALSLVVVGVLVGLRGERRRGAVIAAVSALWFVVATRVVIPFFNGIGPFYDAFFGDLGHSPTEVARSVLTRPGDVLRMVSGRDRVGYLGRMFAPFAFVPLLAPRALLVAAPMLGINLLTEFPYTRDFRFHYGSLVVAGLTIATIEAIARFGQDLRGRALLSATVAAAALVTSVMWGPSPIGRDYRSGIWPLEAGLHQELLEDAVAVVPARAPVSAVYSLVPHLTHRERVYEFPVPWCNVNWGVRGENLHDPATVEWIAVDRERLSEPSRELLDDLLDTEFATRYERSGVVVAQRVQPADAASPRCRS